MRLDQRNQSWGAVANYLTFAPYVVVRRDLHSSTEATRANRMPWNKAGKERGGDVASAAAKRTARRTPFLRISGTCIWRWMGCARWHAWSAMLFPH